MSWKNALRKVTQRLKPDFCRPFFTPKPVDRSRLVSIDFETYFDDEYTLKKLSTSEYVRDPRFKAQMMYLQVGDKPGKVYGHKQIATALRKINWTTHALLCHHTQFDGLILSHHYNVVPSYYYDTLSMARGLHSNEIGAGLEEVSIYYGGAGKLKDLLDLTKGVLNWDKALFDKVTPYCVNDGVEMLRVFDCMTPAMPVEEMDLIDLIVRMFCDPVLKLNIPRIEKELAREIKERDELLASIIDLTPYKADPAVYKKVLTKTKERELPAAEHDQLMVRRIIGSNERFADILRAEGVEPPQKISPAWMKKSREERETEEGIAAKWTYAFAKDDLDFSNLPDTTEYWTESYDLEDPDQVKLMAAKSKRLRELVDARIAVKSTTNITRAERFLISGKDGMCLPVYYAYSRAHTHRLGGGDKRNPQNLQRGGELRQSIEAPPGYSLVVGDSGQIEARVNAYLWGQEDLLQVWRDAKPDDVEDAYTRFASAIYERTITKDDKMERFVGKVCVAGDTRVLTSHGLKSIIEVRSTDLLWDGEAWVHHDGLIDQGIRPVLRTAGFAATADHEILTVHGWQAWGAVLTDASLFRSALALANSSWSAGNTTPPPRANYGATALFAGAPAAPKTWCMPAVCKAVAAHAATYARKLLPVPSGTGFTATPWLMTNTALGFSTGYPPPSVDARTSTTLRSSTTADAASKYAVNGATTVQRSFGTCRLWLAGMTPLSKWIASTPLPATNPATCGSPANPTTSRTSGVSQTSNNVSGILNETTRTYDLANAGPNHRFTVMTNVGPLIVHNCVLGLGFQMGAPKLQITLAKGALGGPPVFFDLARCVKIVNTYRRINNKIEGGWRICADIIEDMAAGRTGSHGPIGWEANKVWLPNGMCLHYPDLKKAKGDKGWDEWTYKSGDMRKKIYGGLLCENIVQALARIIVMYQMLDLSRTDRIVMTTHDEMVSCVKTAQADRGFQRMMSAMLKPQPWCEDIPLAAEGGHALNYSK